MLERLGINAKEAEKTLMVASSETGFKEDCRRSYWKYR